jgi:hypothetical protein
MGFAPRAFTAIAAPLFFLAGIASAQPSPDAKPQAFPKVTIAGSLLRTMKSASTGRDYDLYIHLPTDYDPAKGKKYPVLYILDGQWDFKLMDCILGGLVYDRFMDQIMLVGITYSGENANYNDLRAMDLTPTATPNVKGSGDGPKFLKFLKTEVIPFIEANYAADPSHRLLQGSSYAGLFTLYALFTDPDLFSGYMAASPAVPYDNNDIVKREAAYASAHKELHARLFLAVGGWEGLADPVREFMKTLQSRNYEGFQLETRVIEGERHASNKPELFNRGLKYLFSN